MEQEMAMLGGPDWFFGDYVIRQSDGAFLGCLIAIEDGQAVISGPDTRFDIQHGTAEGLIRAQISEVRHLKQGDNLEHLAAGKP